MARVNRAAPGAPTRISGELFHIIQEAADWTARSDGAFDPGIGALVDAWDLRGSGRIPADPGLRQAREHSGLARFILDESRLEVQRPHPASWIDAGGFGKGAALRAARDELRRRAVRDAILNFGGQVLVLGDTTVTVEVAHPRQRRDPVARLRVREASVSTTSQSERFVEMGGTRYGHVLDPRTGAPVDAWGSVTVIHPDPMIADILSTALFVMGPEQGLRWVEARDIPALFLSLDGQSVRARWSPALQPLLVSPSFNPEGE
jgi:thiamine biosynthesis lipoprotein